MNIQLREKKKKDKVGFANIITKSFITRRGHSLAALVDTFLFILVKLFCYLIFTAWLAQFPQPVKHFSVFELIVFTSCSRLYSFGFAPRLFFFFSSRRI